MMKRRRVILAAVCGLAAAPAQLLELVHHVLAAGLESGQVLLQAGVYHAHHAAHNLFFSLPQWLSGKVCEICVCTLSGSPHV